MKLHADNPNQRPAPGLIGATGDGMKEITIHSNVLKPFNVDVDAAFSFLALMITEDRSTRFWFGSSSGDIDGELSLYINGPDWCVSLDKYKTFKEEWSDNFYLLDNDKKEAVVNKFYSHDISPHELFMFKLGNELKTAGGE